MPESELDTGAIDIVVEAVADLMGADYMPLMEAWADILETDNERFAKMGLDKDEEPLEPVKYRPKDRDPSTVNYTILKNNNLTRSHYAILDGPPLVPRKDGDENTSRVIENFAVEVGRVDEPSGKAEPGDWVASAFWEDFLTPDDEEILPWHFEGAGDLPVRDLRGIRDTTFESCVEATGGFVKAMFDRAFGGGDG